MASGRVLPVEYLQLNCGQAICVRRGSKAHDKDSFQSVGAETEILAVGMIDSLSETGVTLIFVMAVVEICNCDSDVGARGVLHGSSPVGIAFTTGGGYNAARESA